jgi:glycosyltransferase involved in cell wall biosynthesis
MTLLVRDAEALLRENIEFHLQQGVDFFIITDNCSVDGTARIIDEYVHAGIAERIWEPRDDYSQAIWVTRMARRAATEHAADWIVNSDDDEFWSGSTGTLAEELARVPAECEALAVERFNHPALASNGAASFLTSMVFRESRSKNVFGEVLPRKICHRAIADVEVAQGNHAVGCSGKPLPAYLTDAIRISHFPLRDFAAFERKIVNGGAAYARNTSLAYSVGRSWRWLYDVWRRGGLRDWYDRQLLAPEQITEGLADGTLIMDDSVLRAVQAIRGK